MSPLPLRMKSAIRRTGDPFTVSGTQRIGVFRVVGYGYALLFATVAEADTYAKPIRVLTVPADDPTDVGDTVSWSGLTLTVKKKVLVTVAGESICRRLILA
jgi:hypothetical protein